MGERLFSDEDCLPEHFKDETTLNFAMMIRRLARRVEKYEPDSVMAKQAIALLEKNGIKSSPLR